MSVWRKLLPTKFISRCAFAAISLLLAVSVLVSWKSFRPDTNANPISTNIKTPVVDRHVRKGSVNLILPNSVSVVEAKEDANLPHLYKDFEQNPAEFVRKGQGKVNYKFDVPVDAKHKKGKRKHERNGSALVDFSTTPTPSSPPFISAGTPRIKCMINDKTKVTCLRSRAGEVYMPFSFLEDYFEVYGEFVNNTDVSRRDGKAGRGTFYFQHSKTPLFLPTSKYSAKDKFMFFGQYNVEGRTRVMLVSGVHGVPVSNQWDKAGYIYPIQVAQYGLSHHAKLLDEEGAASDRRTVLEDGTKSSSKWVVPPKSKIVYQRDKTTDQDVVYFNTAEDGGRTYPALAVDENRIDSCLSFDVKFVSALANISIVIDAGETRLYVLTYHSDDFYKKSGEDNMIYGIGACRDWCSLNRDVMVDLKKFMPDWNAVKHTLVSIKHVEVRGEGYIDNITVSEKCHEGHFKAASDWIATNQDSNGGWPVPATRVITTQKLTLQPGWYSAMGQGQAISLLVRAYLTYKKPEYIAAAAKGLGVYKKLSTEHGVRARFLDKYNWYEEYPTTPPLFILNGFIYSLLGLYDLTQVAQGEVKVTAQNLFDDGMESLKVMLPLYDSGIGTFYDLRHFTIHGMAPNRARWDYHAVHIAQLQNLGTLDPHPIFNATAKRWIGYMEGEWAPHN